jgi:hypothetical protein
MEEYSKKKEKNCTDKVEKLLSKSFLDEIYSEENKVRPVTSFYDMK